jgi:hypothetical protein
MNKYLLRRLREMEGYVKDSIICVFVNNNGSPPPINFGQYEGWIIRRSMGMFRSINPDIRFQNHDMMILISGEFNQIIKEGFNKNRRSRDSGSNQKGRI